MEKYTYMLKILGKYHFMIFVIVNIACLNSMAQYRDVRSALNYIQRNLTFKRLISNYDTGIHSNNGEIQ